MQPREHLETTATAAGIDEAEAGGILTIDLAAIVANWRYLGSVSTPAACAAVVKADAYGCGLAPVGSALAAAGCSTFFVAHLSEAKALRAVAADAAIYVLNGLMPGTADAYARANLRPVLGSLEEIAEWQAFVAATGWTGAAALHIDTGMNRLGVTVEVASRLARGAVDLPKLDLVMSHLACAETPDHPLTTAQLSAFASIRREFPDIAASLANSSGIFLGGQAHYDLVRPGIALYGVNPTPARPNPMREVVTLRGRIVQVRDVAAGRTVGYGATWMAGRQSRIAIVSIGYADGLLRAASSTDLREGAQAVVSGELCPLAGRVSMDLLAVDVTAVPGGAARRGDFVTLLGNGISVDALAERSGTIAYEILTHLGARYHRHYGASHT